MATYVISDLHGQFGIFESLLKKAKFSKNDKLYMLGDAIDRGPDGIKILQYVMNAPNMEFMLGNHELMMLSAVPEGGEAPASYAKLPEPHMGRWIKRNGGNKTYYKYKLLKKEERVKLISWLKTRRLLIKVEAGGNAFLLTHSYFDVKKIDVPFNELSYDEAWDILWKSPYRDDLFIDHSEYAALSPMKVVLGHVPVFAADRDKTVLEPLFDGNIINVDGACAVSKGKYSKFTGGILLRLDDLKFFTTTFGELRGE
jgi:serine/threonine protein phosphatase 1